MSENAKTRIPHFPLDENLFKTIVFHIEDHSFLVSLDDKFLLEYHQRQPSVLIFPCSSNKKSPKSEIYIVFLLSYFN